jgi:hypothetical protein
VTATRALVTELPTGHRIYLVSDSTSAPWPASGTSSQQNVGLSYADSLTETDLTYTAVVLSGSFSALALTSGVEARQVPVQLVDMGGSGSSWAVGAVLFADDAALYGASGDSWELSASALFMVSPVYPKS